MENICSIHVNGEAKTFVFGFQGLGITLRRRAVEFDVVVSDANTIRIKRTASTIAVNQTIWANSPSASFVVPARRTTPTSRDIDAFVCLAAASDGSRRNGIDERTIDVHFSDGLLLLRGCEGIGRMSSRDIAIGIVDSTAAIAVDDAIITVRTSYVFGIPALGTGPLGGDECASTVCLLLASIIQSRA